MRTVIKIVSVCFVLLMCTEMQVVGQTDSKAAEIDTLYVGVTGMRCQAMCADGLDAVFKNTNGVVFSKTSFEKSSAKIAYDPRIVTDKKLLKIIKKRGFKTSVAKN